MDCVDDVTHFRFFIQTKNKSRRSIYHADFSEYAKFRNNPLQNLRKYETSNLPIFQKKCMPDYFVKIAKFHGFTTDSWETSLISWIWLKKCDLWRFFVFT